MKIYQIYYNKDTLRRLDKEFIPYNNRKNKSTDWYEFEVIYSFLKNNSLQEDVWYGFLSPEFYRKTNLTGSDVKSHLKNNEKSDVCLATSCFDKIAIYQNCFFTTISKLIKTKNSIRVVNNQIGSPTLVNNFIGSLLVILEFLNKNNLGYIANKKIWGIYNLSNRGVTSWYKFACKIAFKMGYNPLKKIIPVNFIDYESVANRPLNSRLDNSKIRKTFGIELPYWEDSFNDFYENSS